MKRSRFRYVDFAAAGQEGFRNRVVSVDEVEPLVARYGADECYASIFWFADDILLYLAEHQVNGRGSIAGYDGRVWTPFLPLDIDASPPAALGDALDLTRRIHRLLETKWQLPAQALHVYFSGAKGFHLLIDTRAFGRVRPSTTLHRIFSRLRLEILRDLPDAARLLFDLTIGDKVRLLRLPNTRHRTSRLYKIALEPPELFAASAEQIRALAAAPRPLRRVTAAGLRPVDAVDAAPAAVEMFARARRVVRRQRGPHPYRLAHPPEAPEHALCAARLAMWQSRVPLGFRNNAVIRLASAFRLAGYTEAQTMDLLLVWNRQRRIDLSERELRAVVRSAYARPYPYTYGCHDEVIRHYCPYTACLSDCEDYRLQTPRSGRTA